jgi:hypothetical protein
MVHRRWRTPGVAALMSTSRTSDATIQSQMPRPIAALWSAMLACSDTAERATRLVGIVECTLQILEGLLVADYLSGPKDATVDRLLRDAGPRTLGKRSVLVQEVLRALRDRGLPAFAPDSVTWWWNGPRRTEHGDRVERLVRTRNEAAHDEVKARPVIADVARAIKLEGEVRDLLDSLGWLAARPLARVLSSEQTTSGRMRGTIEFIVGQERPARRIELDWAPTVPLLRERVYWFSSDYQQVLDVSALFGVASGVAEPVLLIPKKLDAARPVLVDPLGLREPPDVRGYLWGDQRLCLEELLQRSDGAERRREMSVAPSVSQDRPLETGQIAAGRYRLVARLGKGGMADVWRALDQETGEEIALKVMLPQAAQDATLRDRFSREAETMRRVSHPRVLACHHAENVQGRPALVLPLMRGGTLQARTGSSSTSQVRAWTREALEGLAALHEHGIVHRDIKPSNLLLDEDAHLHVGDLGVVLTPERSRLTLTKEVVGTPAFMAPEQLNEQDATSATDVFSLALVMHQVITGTLPGDRRPGRGIDGELGQLLRAMGDPDPSRRPSAKEALARIGATEEPRSPAPRRRIPLPLLAAIAALGIAALVGLTVVTLAALTIADSGGPRSGAADTVKKARPAEPEGETTRHHLPVPKK